MYNPKFRLLTILIVTTMILVACAPAAAPTAEPTQPPPPTEAPPPPPTEAPPPTEVPEPTEVPTAEPPAGPPDLTGETITLYHFGDLSGPYAAITSPLIHGAEDAVKAINETGGIYGAKLEFQFADNAGNIDEAVAAYDRFTGEDENPLLMITYGSGEVEALAQRFAEDKIVNLTAAFSSKALYGEGSGYTLSLIHI